MIRYEFPPFLSTAIGSIGIKNPEEAVSLHIKYLDIPCWPQLPQRSFLENMYVQFSEGFPGVVIDEVGKKIYVKEDAEDKKIVEFYENILNKNYNYFKINSNYALGLYELAKVKKSGFIKGQITGPVSYGLTVTFSDKRAIFYNEKWRDILVKMISAKGIWQIRFLKKISDKVIIFIDEPYLTSIGSGYVTISEDALISALGEVIQELKKEDVLIGIHCCGNTDWQLLNKLELDIINFDSFNYPQSILVYPEVVKDILLKEKYIAWGIVPSSKEINDITINILKERLNLIFNELAKKGIDSDLLKTHSLLTPSCGMGSLLPEEGIRVLEVLKELSDFLKGGK
jgi:hypothetical protein